MDIEQIDAHLDENHFTGCGAGIDDSVGECAETNSPAEYSGESVPPIPGESVPGIPRYNVPPIPGQSVPPF